MRGLFFLFLYLFTASISLSQEVDTTFKLRVGISVPINKTLELNADYFIISPLYVTLKAGYTFNRKVNYPFFQGSETINTASGSFVKLGLNVRGKVSEFFYLFIGLHGGVSHYKNLFDVSIDYFYGTYKNQFLLDGYSRTLSIPTGHSWLVKRLNIEYGMILTFAEAIKGELAPGKYFLPGSGILVKNNNRPNSSFGISQFITLKYSFLKKAQLNK